MTEKEALHRLARGGIRPSLQRLAIMEYLLTHRTHPTVDDVYSGLCGRISTLSKTTVYNTLRMFAERQVATMITIDDHHVCYDGDIHPHGGRATTLLQGDLQKLFGGTGNDTLTKVGNPARHQLYSFT